MSYNIKSMVFDADMFPLANANIVEVRTDGKENKTRTDENGRFQLSVPSKDSIIKISHVGYVTEEMKANDPELYSYIQLENDVSLLDPLELRFQNAKKTSAWLWVFLTLGAAGTLYYFNREKFKKVKI